MEHEGIRSAEIVCVSDDSLTNKTKHLNAVFIKNYSKDYIERYTYVRPNYGPNDSSNNSYTSTATMPYKRGTSETIVSILYTTLQHPSCTQTHVKLNLNLTYKQATLSTGTLLPVSPTVPTTINKLHSKAGLLAKTKTKTNYDYHLTLKMASAQVVETSVANNSPSQYYNRPDDLFHSRYTISSCKPFWKLVIILVEYPL